MMPRSPIHQTMRGCALACCALWMIGGGHWSRTASGAQDAAQPAPNPDPALEVRVEPLAPDALRDPTELPPRLVTSDGRTYENARVMRIEKGGIMVRHATGLSLLRFGELPAEIAARFQPLTPPQPRLGSPLPRARAPTVAAPRGPENGPPDGRAAGGKGGPWYDWRAGTGPVPAFLLGLGAVTALAGLAGLLRHAGRLCGAAEATYMRALTIVLLATVLAAALAILHAGVVLGEEAFVLRSFA